MSGNYVMIDVQDPRSSVIAEVLGNKTAKRILGLLAERELSQTELARDLRLPASTIDYNIKKLKSAGLVEQVNSLLSSRGKRVPIYKVSEKKIVISPKTMMKGVVPAAIFSLGAAAAIKLFYGSNSGDMISGKSVPTVSTDYAVREGASVLSDQVYGSVAQASPVWAWFLLGALTALVIFLLWNWGNKK